MVDGEKSHFGGVGEEESLLGDESDVDLEALVGVFWFTCLDQWGWTPPGPLILSFNMSRVGAGDAIGFVDVPCAEGEMEVPVSGDLSELFTLMWPMRR